ncbi:MAG: flagellar export chaperone FliS [Gammaproteobacteria bacterium]|nr:flagellar export chaperone FliS [Gammaproteobacteria bacterium]
MYSGQKSGLNQYQKVNSQSNAAFASPHRLIQMLMDGALEKISRAKGYMEQKNIPKKGEFIGWAISIIEGLRVSLDFEKGGEISENLNALYDYMERRLAEANSQNSTDMLDEVTFLLSEIKEGWDAIPKSIIDEHAAKYGHQPTNHITSTKI